MEAICYMKTGTREVVLLLVCVFQLGKHTSGQFLNYWYVFRISIAKKKSKEKTSNGLDICSTVRPMLRDFRWFLYFA